jgi:hypothetical protein
VHGFPGYSRDQPLPTLTDILDGTGTANSGPILVASIPGSQWRYSGGGYIVLQKLMIDVTGQPFPTLMSEMVLKTLQMEHSTFEQPLPPSSELLAAAGHQNGKTVPGQWNVYPEMAAAGLWTTPSDLAHLVIAVQQAKGGQKNGVISPIIAQWMTTPVLNGDGLGLFMTGPHDEIFGHSGRNAGFDSLVRASTLDGVVMMINANDDTGVLNRICEAAWNEAALIPPWPTPNRRLDPAIDPKTYAEYVGRYDYGDAIQEITVEKGHIFAQLTGQNKFEIFPSGPDAFFFKVVEAGLVFDRDKTGFVTGITHTQDGDTFTALKLSDKDAPVLPLGVLDAIVGRYQYGPLSVLTVTRRDDQLYAQLTGQPEFPIFPKSDHEFYWKIVPASVEFVKGPDGKITGAIHHQNGITFSAPKIKPQ